MNNYFKPTLKNLSQGARLEYVRKLRYMFKDDVADYFEWKLNFMTDTIKLQIIGKIYTIVMLLTMKKIEFFVIY